jgi:hypothetical protein
MMNNISKIQKILLLPLAVVVLASFDTPKAQAQVPGVFVPVYDGITDTTTLKPSALFQDVTKMSLDTLSYQAGQLALNQLTQNTVSWIRGGFNGSPAFAVDPNKLFLDLADMVAMGLGREIRGIQTCNFSPTFNNDLANMLELATRSDAPAKFVVQATCPFPSTINTSAFYTAGLTSFEQNGGWKAMEASLNDSGNRFGLNIISGQELAARQQEARSIQEQKASWSGGFMDLVDTGSCTYPEGMDTATFGGADPSAIASIQRTYCKITTPGKIIQSQLSDTLSTDMQRLGFADNLNKIIAALLQQIAREAVTGIFR